MPGDKPRINQIVNETNGSFSRRRKERDLSELKNANLCSFKLSRSDQDNGRSSVAMVVATACDLQIHWKVSFLSFNLNALISI
jgi:hypothetical protein